MASHSRFLNLRRVESTAAVLGLAGALGLWSLGALAVPAPWLLRTCLVLALGGGAVTLLGWGAGRLARWLGVASLVAGAGFLFVLFQPGLRGLPVVRGAAAPAVPLERIRLVDLNVLHGYPDFRQQRLRSDHLVAALRALAPDLLVLQEAWIAEGHGDLTARLASELGMGAAFARANGHRRLLGFEEGSAVLSRFPIVRAERRPLRPRQPPWEQRVALVATVDLGCGRQLTVVGTHLAHDAPEVAAAQARHLASLLPPAEPLILAGDLNAESGTITLLALEAHGLVDLLPGGIDHVLARPAGFLRGVLEARWTLRPRDLEALIGQPAEISDHPGIVVDLSLTPCDEMPRP